MLERICSYLLLAAVSAAPLSGCAYMTKSGRQQMAYQHYVRKNSGRKMKQQKKLKPTKMPLTPAPSDNQISTELQSPQSVHSNEAPQPATAEQPPNGN